MRTLLFTSLLISLPCTTNLAVQPRLINHSLHPYVLPTGAQRSLDELAKQCDVLILGETHGTREVPGIVASLLASLAKARYGTLALEIPADQQGPLTDWALGKTTVVPSFFAQPTDDGRGNAQVL